MAGEATFPTTDQDTDTYLRAAVPYLEAEKVRLDVSPVNLSNLNILFKGLPNGWTTVFPKHTNPLTSTPANQKKKEKLIVDIFKLLRIIYADIKQSVLIQEDKSVLRIIDDDTVLTERGKIEGKPITGIRQLGSGEIKFTNRVLPDATRASKHKSADFVEMKWGLFDLNAPKLTDPDALPKTKQSTRAVFTFAFGAVNIGKRVDAAFRWGITGAPEKSGGWSDIRSFVLGS